MKDLITHFEDESQLVQEHVEQFLHKTARVTMRFVSELPDALLLAVYAEWLANQCASAVFQDLQSRLGA